MNTEPPRRTRFRFPFRTRSSIEREVDDEIRFHLDMREEDLVRAGIEPAEARRQAREEFGDLETARRTMRRTDDQLELRARLIRSWVSVVHDMRYAVLSLLRAPAFALLAIATLSVGIGSATAIYTAVKRIVFDPLPLPEADRIVRLRNEVPRVSPGEEWDMSTAQYFHYLAEARSFDEVGAFNHGPLTVRTSVGTERVHGALVTSGLTRIVGARPILGRSIEPGDDVPGAEPIAVLGEAFWREHFGADPEVLGQALELQDIPLRIVGVVADGSDLPPEPGTAFQQPPAVWGSLGAIDARFAPEGPFYPNHTIPMLARLSPGVSLAEARAELDALTPRLGERYPELYGSVVEQYGFHPTFYPVREYVLGGIAESLWILFGATGLVLLVACANVGNLLVVRAEGRRRELAVRMAVGAGRTAIVRRFIAEALALAVSAGVIGFALAAIGTRLLVSVAPETVPRLNEIRPDLGVGLFALGAALAIAMILPAAPALRTRGMSSRTFLADGERGSTPRAGQHLRSFLLVTQVTLAVVLIVGSGLLIESFRRISDIDPGIDAEGVVTLDLSLPRSGYDQPEEMWRFYQALLRDTRVLPGVTAAGTSQALPFTGSFGCTVQGFDDAGVYERISSLASTNCAAQQHVSPGYFDAAGIPILAGRAFTDLDNDRPVGAVVVSQAFAERFWPGEEPIGKGVAPNGRRSGPFYRVVGVVGDVYGGSPTEDPAIVVYYPHTFLDGGEGAPPREQTLVVRTELSDPLALVGALRAAVGRIDPDVVIGEAREMAELEAAATAQVRFVAILLGTAATIALLLAAVGLYGVVSSIVARRTGEIAIRMAVGARSGQVQRLVVGGTLRLACAGVGIGVATALTTSRLLESLLYEVEPASPRVYVGAMGLLISVAILASWIPARRASRVDPATTLR